MRVGSALLIDRAAEASSLADVVSTGPVLVVLVNNNELAVGLGDGFVEAGGSNADVEVFVVNVELGGERHFIFVVFVGGKLKKGLIYSLREPFLKLYNKILTLTQPRTPEMSGVRIVDSPVTFHSPLTGLRSN